MQVYVMLVIWYKCLVQSIVFQTVQNARMGNLKLVNGMGFHLKVTDSKNIDVTRLSISAPQDSPNTDGIHLSSSINVRVTDSVIGTGDDCVSIGHGTENILVSGVICGPGHGLRYSLVIAWEY